MSKKLKQHHIIIGNNIRTLREYFGMSMDELAELLGLSTAFIGLVERGNRGIKLENMLRIADIFGATMNDLVQESSVQDISKELTESEIYISRITIWLNQLSEKELSFVMNVVKDIPLLREDNNYANINQEL